eukprot:7223538-Alexandrium_andersonii.AAC.1
MDAELPAARVGRRGDGGGRARRTTLPPRGGKRLACAEAAHPARRVRDVGARHSVVIWQRDRVRQKDEGDLARTVGA